jgi:hypothetical protein
MTLDMAYNNEKGVISNKSDLGALIYKAPNNPYAVSGINPLTGVIPFAAQAISYISFESASAISEADCSATFIYVPDIERARMVVQQDSSVFLIRWYLSSNYIIVTVPSLSGTLRKDESKLFNSILCLHKEPSSPSLPINGKAAKD